MEEKILQTIRQYNLITKEEKIVIGVSGGPDSITLLNVLINLKKQHKIDCQLVVCHVNHMIREEAGEDEKFVQEFCKERKIPCYVKRIDVKKIATEQKMGTEEMGRQLRYQFFNEILEKEKAQKIATAHNANDNAETVLMNIMRGTSTSGLKGIEIKRGNLIRPLRECTRQEIENYCMENELHPRIDKTNFENTYTRNKVRNLLIPYIQKNFNPNITASINRLSALASQEDEYIEKTVKKIYCGILEEKEKTHIALDLKAFNQLETVIKNRLVLYTIGELFGTKNGIEKKHIEDIIKLCSNNIGNKYLIPNKKVKILVKNKKIFFMVNGEHP